MYTVQRLKMMHDYNLQFRTITTLEDFMKQTSNVIFNLKKENQLPAEYKLTICSANYLFMYNPRKQLNPLSNRFNINILNGFKVKTVEGLMLILILEGGESFNLLNWIKTEKSKYYLPVVIDFFKKEFNLEIKIFEIVEKKQKRIYEIDSLDINEYLNYKYGLSEELLNGIWGLIQKKNIIPSSERRSLKEIYDDVKRDRKILDSKENKQHKEGVDKIYLENSREFKEFISRHEIDGIVSKYEPEDEETITIALTEKKEVFFGSGETF